jgi:hypothetical protein
LALEWKVWSREIKAAGAEIGLSALPITFVFAIFCRISRMGKYTMASE